MVLIGLSDVGSVFTTLVTKDNKRPDKITINLEVDNNVDSIGKFLIGFCIQTRLKKFRFSQKDGKRLDYNSEILVRDDFYPLTSQKEGKE